MYFKVEVTGKSNTEKFANSRLILISNHQSYLDPVVLEAFSSSLRLYFMAKKELFEVPILGFIIKKLGAFPVNRGKNDFGALKKAEEIVCSGNVLAIFPEGRRCKTGGFLKPKVGFVKIGLNSGASIMPCSIFYSGKFPRSKLSVTYGEPVNLSEIIDRKNMDGKNLVFDDFKKIANDVWQNVIEFNILQKRSVILK